MIGRAQFTKPTSGPDYKILLPRDLTVIHEWEDVPRGETYVIVEGERLPPWVRGNTPWSFDSLDKMLAYRRGNHS